MSDGAEAEAVRIEAERLIREMSRSGRSAFSNNYRATWRADMEAAGHTPKLDDDGDINMFVVDVAMHNGPGCLVCGWDVCSHCHGDKPIPPCTVAKS